MAIDWDFIDSLEGKGVLKGYVPKNKKGEVIGKSGVTIGTGFDIGQHSPIDVMRLLGEDNRVVYANLLMKLTRYCGYKGNDAVKMLKEYPLELTEGEAFTLDLAVKRKFMQETSENWDTYNTTKFKDLPNEIQTVLFSLGYNFGAKLSRSLPYTFKVFKDAVAQNNYYPVVGWLQFFPGKNPELRERRKKEAFYIKQSMVKQG